MVMRAIFKHRDNNKRYYFSKKKQHFNFNKCLKTKVSYVKSQKKLNKKNDPALNQTKKKKVKFLIDK